MVADYMPPEKARRSGDPGSAPHRPLAPDARRILGAAPHGIFRSGDGARSWTEVKAKPSSFGFAVAVHPRDPDTAWSCRR